MNSPQFLYCGVHTFQRGYLDGYHNRPNQSEIAGDDHLDTLNRRAYGAGYIAGVIDASEDHAEGR